MFRSLESVCTADGIRAKVASSVSKRSMALVVFLAAWIAAAATLNAESPIRVENAQINPVDLSVSFEFVNEAVDVTAYELSITRHFSDGSKIVSTQGRDWFSDIGYVHVSVPADSVFCAWLPGRPSAPPGTHTHRWPFRSKPTANPVYAEVRLTAVIRLDGEAVGSRRVLERLFAERRAMLTEYTYWVPQLQRVSATEDPLAALGLAADLLKKRRPGEMARGPREALLRAATQMHRWSKEHPEDAARVFDAIIKTANHQLELLADQSVQREARETTNEPLLAPGDDRVCR